MRIHLLSLAVSTLIAAPALDAQCKNCCKEAPAPAVTATTNGKTEPKTELPRLFNEVCPVTGNPTSADTPVVAHAGFRVSLCCASCLPLYAKLADEKKADFLAGYTGKNRRTAFAPAKAQGKPVAKGAATGDCCNEKPAAKPVTRPDCCTAAAKPAATPAEKPAEKPTAKPAAKPAAKPDCCSAEPAQKAAKGPDCCKEKPAAAKTPAEPAAKTPGCCDAKAAAKAQKKKT